MVRSILSYISVGLVNTLLTMICILGLTRAGFQPEIANIAGYCLGLCSSYTLNRIYTFSSKGAQTLPKFIAAFLVCYAVNLIVLRVMISWFEMDVLLSQMFAMLSYNVSFFLLLKLWAFRQGAEE